MALYEGSITLDISENHLTELPQSLFKLNNLVSLDISDNKIKYLESTKAPNYTNVVSDFAQVNISHKRKIPQSLEKE